MQRTLFLQVMKAVSGKFHPLFQWFYFDSIESLPPIEELTPEACAEKASWVHYVHCLHLVAGCMHELHKLCPCAHGVLSFVRAPATIAK